MARGRNLCLLVCAAVLCAVLQGGSEITHCCILGALLESRFDFHPFLLHVRGQLGPNASPIWRITTNEGWKVGRMTKPSRKPSRYDREKPYHFEVRMKLWLSRIIFHVWTIELRRCLKVTFQDRCLGFPKRPCFPKFMKMVAHGAPVTDGLDEFRSLRSEDTKRYKKARWTKENPLELGN